MKKMWHIYTMEYYSAIKRNKIELFEKNKYRMLTHIYEIQKRF